MNRVLWILQGLLAVVFLFAGSAKWMMAPEALAAQSPLPVEFLRFIGACEVLGALGLILPGVFRVRVGLTPLAAAGLAIIMVGASATTLAINGGVLALMPFLIGLLAVCVVVGRTDLSRLRARRALPAAA
jgi:hypothetical protein